MPKVELITGVSRGLGRVFTEEALKAVHRFVATARNSEHLVDVATIRFQRDYDGRQPGDPIKAAGALLYIASLSEPPLRLLLGSDDHNAGERHTMQISAADGEWKAISISTGQSF